MDWTIEDNGKIKAKITQIPLRLAWAMTVHKSQGMSMDAAVMDYHLFLNMVRVMWLFRVSDV